MYDEKIRAKEEICRIMRRTYECGLTTSLGGNISMRLGSLMLITPSSLGKPGTLTCCLIGCCTGAGGQRSARFNSCTGTAKQKFAFFSSCTGAGAQKSTFFNSCTGAGGLRRPPLSS